MVNQVGKRFYDETKGDYPHGNVYNDIDPYTPNDYRNNENIHYHPSNYNFFNAAVAMNEYSEPPEYSAGPIWAIFDSEAVARNKWNVEPPYVDPDGYFFSANTLAELAAKIKNDFQAKPMKGETLGSHGGSAITRLSMPAKTKTSASRRRSTRSKTRRSTPPGHAQRA